MPITNMSINDPKSPTIDSALSSVPSVFRVRLVKYYRELKQAYIRGAFDACGSRAGKFCETLIRFIQQELEGSHAPFGQQINLCSVARKLEGLPQTTGNESLRVFIPRAICFLYTLRNKRGFAHVGADLDSDPIDAITCVRLADWCLCELIRIFKNLPLEEAQTLINTISTRESLGVWPVAGKKRVLKKGLSYKDQVLLLMYSEVTEAVLIEDLFEWTEYSRMKDFRHHVLAPLHRDRFIEWDKDTDAALISPLGVHKVETEILSKQP